MPLTAPDTGKWWRHRRRHSYLSLLGLFAMLVSGVFAPADQLVAAMPLLQTLAWVFGAVILTYVGAATLEDIAKLRGPTITKG